MNILYEGMSGSAANPQLGGLLLCIGIVILIAEVILLIALCANDNWLILLIIPFMCITIGIVNLIDSRTPIVKAILDDTISFTEVQKDYEYVGKEGDIYTFKPRNVNIDEWEQLIKEKNN